MTTDTNSYMRTAVPLIVMKFGGTSPGDAERIRAVAQYVARTHRQGTNVVVVASAMSRTTDDLLELAHKVSVNPSGRELDMLLSTGECIATSLLCLALETFGVAPRSYSGASAGFKTDNRFGSARTVAIDTVPLCGALETGIVPVVTGFQGATAGGDVTTLAAVDLTRQRLFWLPPWVPTFVRFYTTLPVFSPRILECFHSPGAARPVLRGDA